MLVGFTAQNLRESFQQVFGITAEFDARIKILDVRKASIIHKGLLWEVQVYKSSDFL